MLLTLAEQAGLFGSGEFTTTQLARQLNVSQQTISNILRRLEKEKLITRQATYSGTIISISEQGRELLKSYQERLLRISKGLNQIKGRVFTGIGEGIFYTEQKGYKIQFMRKLNIRPYPGTLNIRVEPVEKKKFLQNKKPIVIDGFVTKKRTFGKINSYLVKIKEMKAAIIMPERSHYHDDTIEIISNVDLRKRVNLKDGDEMVIE